MPPSKPNTEPEFDRLKQLDAQAKASLIRLESRRDQLLRELATLSDSIEEAQSQAARAAQAFGREEMSLPQLPSVESMIEMAMKSNPQLTLADAVVSVGYTRSSAMAPAMQRKGRDGDDLLRVFATERNKKTGEELILADSARGENDYLGYRKTY